MRFNTGAIYTIFYKQQLLKHATETCPLRSNWRAFLHLLCPLLKSSRGAFKPLGRKTYDWVNTTTDTKLDKDSFVITKISLMFHRALNPKDENNSSHYWL